MDKIYDITKSKPINFKKFFDEYTVELKKTEFPQNNEDIQRLIGLEGKNDDFEKIKTSISLELLDSPDDTHIIPYVPGISEYKRKPMIKGTQASTRLQTLQQLIKVKGTSQQSPFGKTQYSFKQIQTTTDPADHNLEPFSDIVVTVRFYRPKMDSPYTRKIYPRFNEEFHCLGSNLLTELRDKISCICNKKRFFELSERPTASNPDKLCDPGFFFIEDTFYNDMRNADNHDYSKVIREWAAKGSRGHGKLDFKSCRMEDFRFIDLEASLGFPQLYQHHGNCEHLFTFSYLEVLSKHNCLVRELYPVLKSVNAYNAKFCNMCGKREFAYVVRNSTRQLHDPAYLCSVCLFSFHYVNGKKVGEFSAYRIVSYNEKLDDHESFVIENLDDEVEEEEDELSSDEATPAKVKKEC